MAADAAALLFHFGEIATLVQIRIGIFVPGDGVEAWALGGAAGVNPIRHAHDGGRVHAAAELGKDGAVGAKPALDSLRKYSAEVLFVFGIGAVADSLGGIEIPKLADGVFSGPEENKRGRRDGMDAN